MNRRAFFRNLMAGAVLGATRAWLPNKLPIPDNRDIPFRLEFQWRTPTEAEERLIREWERALWETVKPEWDQARRNLLLYGCSHPTVGSWP